MALLQGSSVVQESRPEGAPRNVPSRRAGSLVLPEWGPYCGCLRLHRLAAVLTLLGDLAQASPNHAQNCLVRAQSHMAGCSSLKTEMGLEMPRFAAIVVYKQNQLSVDLWYIFLRLSFMCVADAGKSVDPKILSVALKPSKLPRLTMRSRRSPRSNLLWSGICIFSNSCMTSHIKVSAFFINAMSASALVTRLS